MIAVIIAAGLNCPELRELVPKWPLENLSERKHRLDVRMIQESRRPFQYFETRTLRGMGRALNMAGANPLVVYYEALHGVCKKMASRFFCPVYCTV